MERIRQGSVWNLAFFYLRNGKIRWYVLGIHPVGRARLLVCGLRASHWRFRFVDRFVDGVHWVFWMKLFCLLSEKIPLIY